ncbi:MAG: hypothetical protein COA86_10515 [Kangiella sp.]|nr:MAG: hypothetical protein COA86_10515 [Kangiella sp.]
MKLIRRRRLIKIIYKWCIVTLLLFCTISCQQEVKECLEDCQVGNSLARLPVVGLEQKQQIPILVKAKSAGNVRIEYRKIDAKVSQFSESEKLVEENDYTVNLNLNDIASGQKYQYRVEFSQENYSPWYQFNSFPKAGVPGKFSFVFSACLREKYLDYDIFSQIKSISPTFVALTGDQMYGDYDGNINKLESYLSNDKLRQEMISKGEKVLDDKNILDAFRSKYNRVFGSSYQNLTTNIPMMAMWDDHDFGEDNSDGTYPYKQQARQAFVENFPANPYEDDNAGLYYSFSVADVDVLVLDTRWYRSPMQNEDNQNKLMLGKKQLAWLLENLKKSTSKIKIVFSSVPLNDYGGDTSSNRPGYDSWVGYQHERSQVLSFIETNNIEGVLFFSGDQHYPSAHILNKKSSLQPIIQNSKYVEYKLADLGTSVLDFSASPLSYKKASGRKFELKNQSDPNFAYELFRPDWAHPKENKSHDAPIVVGSVYGLAEIDTSTSPATTSVTFYELNAEKLVMEEIYRIKINL